MKHIISLGAGVQSSTMALMAAHGEFGAMPECAVFADTGAEPKYVYEWLDWLETKLPFPVHRVMHKEGLLVNLREHLRDAKFAAVPFYTESPVEGKTIEGRLRRQCTREFKLQPLETFIRRQVLGLAKGERGPRGPVVRQWIGISMDEIQRMKAARVRFIENVFPLIEWKQMTRGACLRWMQEHGYPLPKKSSCTFCPYHDDGLWRELKNEHPEDFAQAVEVDRLIRNGVRGTEQKLYLHRSLKPLEEVDFRNAEDVGQTDMFKEECDGMCGV